MEKVGVKKSSESSEGGEGMTHTSSVACMRVRARSVRSSARSSVREYTVAYTVTHTQARLSMTSQGRGPR